MKRAKMYKVNVYVQGSDKPIKMKFSEHALEGALEGYRQNEGILTGGNYIVDITKVSHIKILSKNIR